MAMANPDRDAYLMQQFRALAGRYEISDYYAGKLRQLEGWEVVLILDDSGSMNTPLAGVGGDPFGVHKTRWQELKQIVQIMIDIGAVLDKDGLDLYFLNRATVLNVTSSAQVEGVFATPPAGMTPTTTVLQHVLATKQQVAAEKRVLVIIATDGAPTNPRGDEDVMSLYQVLANQRDPNRFHVQFIACTDDPGTVSYLNDWDRRLPHLDVTDDYISERAEIQRRKGMNFPFSFGSYVVKALLGSIDPEFDTMDEQGQMMMPNGMQQPQMMMQQQQPMMAMQQGQMMPMQQQGQMMQPGQMMGQPHHSGGLGGILRSVMGVGHQQQQFSNGPQMMQPNGQQMMGQQQYNGQQMNGQMMNNGQQQYGMQGNGYSNGYR